MRKTLLAFCFLSLNFLSAQEDPYFRQMENMLRTFNPAFNGIEDFDKRSLLLNFRDQFMNFSSGEPITFSATYGGRFDKLHGGADVSYLYDQIGLQKANWIGLKYDAQFALGEKTDLGIGARANFGFVSFDFGSAVTTAPDPILPTGIQKGTIIPDIDFGLMVTRGTSFFFSLSARHLTEPSATVKGPTGIDFDINTQYRTYYAMLGGRIERGKHLTISYAADYRQTGSTGHGEGRIEARWRFLYAGFFCVLDRWKDSNTGMPRYVNPYGFTFGFSRKDGRLHIISSYEPAYINNSFGSSFETGVKYVFGKKD
ncbi:MAG TPA: PorP/SprF family type IX secretion system membrane protein [Bacteroidia bacterium]|jgi:type IX secretion system PorP/SprF family membrane protein|nr:PorP/SprF family type IX secretion system membrane protein [Bacteroidia bacterium]